MNSMQKIKHDPILTKENQGKEAKLYIQEKDIYEFIEFGLQLCGHQTKYS